MLQALKFSQIILNFPQEVGDYKILLVGDKAASW